MKISKNLIELKIHDKISYTERHYLSIAVIGRWHTKNKFYFLSFW